MTVDGTTTRVPRAGLPRTADASPVRPVHLHRKTVEAYRRLCGDEIVAELRALAAPLRGLRVLELSSTATGGGVAELLSSLVPLQRDLGLEAEWRVIAGDPPFFAVTKRLHNGLQGMPIELTDRDRGAYLGHNATYAAALEAAPFDVVIVHDPQPAAVRTFLPDHPARWVWRCHVDSSSADVATWAFLRPFVDHHDRAVFTLESFVPRDIGVPTTTIVPAIDPLTSKNQVIPEYLARETVAQFGVDTARPLVVQVSRFDPWKNPLGVVAAWRLAREDAPGLQLALVGSMATDDPEGWEIYAEVESATHGEPDCFLLTNQMGVASHEVNAFQRTADVAVQMSTREGFGLVVAETLWKGTPMIAGHAGGIPLQLEDGVSGVLADSPGDVATAISELLQDPARAAELGVAGARRVHERFLLPRLLADQLRLLRTVTAT
jgi:trehalose synthase